MHNNVSYLIKKRKREAAVSQSFCAFFLFKK